MKKSCANCIHNDFFADLDQDIHVCMKHKIVLQDDLETTTCPQVFLTPSAQVQIAVEESAIVNEFKDARAHNCHNTKGLNEAMEEFQISLVDDLIDVTTRVRK